MSDVEFSKPSRIRRNYLSREGAEALKAQIEEHWRRAGKTPRIIIEKAQGLRDDGGLERWDVRSNIVNGLPR